MIYLVLDDCGSCANYSCSAVDMTEVYGKPAPHSRIPLPRYTQGMPTPTAEEETDEKTSI